MSVSKMQKLTVFAFREDADSIVRRLMNLRCVEVRTADPARGAAARVARAARRFGGTLFAEQHRRDAVGERERGAARIADYAVCVREPVVSESVPDEVECA